MGGSPGRIDNPNPPFRVKREAPRFAFIANVEVTELSTDARTSGRISEISRKGCFIDTSNILPVGTLVKIVISREQETFTTDGTVIYTQEGKGMAMAFKDSTLEQLAILGAWLGASTSRCYFIPESSTTD